jgi:L-seryl-tRNA(Ser) seleniumtransferase
LAPREAMELVRRLPAVSKELGQEPFRRLAEAWGPRLVTELLREEIGRLREAILAGDLGEDALALAASTESLAAGVEAAGRALLGPAPRTVVNASGVVVHTNLGRSVLSEASARRVADAARTYVALEYDLSEGGRGSRGAHLEPLLGRLFPGYASLAVNNNAAAILLTLRALARGKEVVVSRGELVEIGGSFRVPEILSVSGAKLREVGTTNRTRLADYEDAIGPRTGLLLKVHPSNFRIIGFTEEAVVRELSELARRSGIPLVVDWGSGDLVDLEPLGIQDEQPVQRILAEGADLVTFSGDKLLGGPQAGIAVGRAELILRMRKDPLARACRLDRLLTAAMRETLSAYLRGSAMAEIPTLRMLALGAEEIGRRAEAVRAKVEESVPGRARLDVVDGVSRTGGGSAPASERPTRLLSVQLAGADAATLERELRAGDPPVIGRIQGGRLLLDLRTVLPDQDELVARRLADAIRRRSGS